MLGWIITCWLFLIAGLLLLNLDVNINAGYLIPTIVMFIALPILVGKELGFRLSRTLNFAKYAKPPKIRIIFLTGVGSLVIGLATAIVASKIYWGYAFFRPESINVGEKNYKTISLVEVDGDIQGLNISYPLVDGSGTQSFIPFGRVPSEMAQRGLIPVDSKPIDPRIIEQLTRRLWFDKNLQLEEEGGYLRHEVKHIHGSLLEMSNIAGDRFLLASLGGGEVGRNHYPYYEFLFSIKGQSLGKLIDRSFFYHDVPPLDYAEWWVVGPILSIVLFLAILPLLLIRHARRDKRVEGN